MPSAYSIYTCDSANSYSVPTFSSLYLLLIPHQGAYRHLMKPEDYEREKWVQLFNKFDLYTKDEGNDLRGEKMQEELWPYYSGLIEKYGLGGKLKW